MLKHKKTTTRLNILYFRISKKAKNKGNNLEAILRKDIVLVASKRESDM